MTEDLMDVIEIDCVFFGQSISEPGHSQRIATQLQSAHGFEMVFDPRSGLLHVRKEGHRKIYPITNIKEMRPKPVTVVPRETKKGGRPSKDYSLESE